MTRETAPDLVIVSRLADPVMRGSQRLDDILHDTTDLREDSVLLKGAVVLAVAAVENALLDCLRYFFAARPSAIAADSFTVEPHELLTRSSRDVLMARAEKKLRTLSFQPFTQQLQFLARTLDIVTPAGSDLDAFLEFKETRNLIVHADLRATGEYIARSGVKARASKPRDVLTVDVQYVTQQVLSCAAVLDALRIAIYKKYQANTRIAAIRRLWSWMFHSPVMEFDDLWVVDQSRDEVIGYKSPGTRISHGEEVMLNLWLAHFNASAAKLPLTMPALDEANRRKVLHFLSVLEDFGLY